MLHLSLGLFTWKPAPMWNRKQCLGWEKTVFVDINKKFLKQYHLVESEEEQDLHFIGKPKLQTAKRRKRLTRYCLLEYKRGFYNLRWKSLNGCKDIGPEWTERKLCGLIELKRKEISTVIGLLIGHNLFGKHAERLGVTFNDSWSWREEDEPETLKNFLCECSTLWKIMLKSSGCGNL